MYVCVQNADIFNFVLIIVCFGSLEYFFIIIRLKRNKAIPCSKREERRHQIYVTGYKNSDSQHVELFYVRNLYVRIIRSIFT